MNFLDMCYDVFTRTSQYHDLGKDLENYNKLVYYSNNFYSIDRSEIERFIVEVRFDNLIYSTTQQLGKVISGPLKKLWQLTPDELYKELQGEIVNIILKGAYDSIKLLYNLDEQQSANLANRIATGDMSLFEEYKC